MTPQAIQGDAIFSECGRYRYLLTRKLANDNDRICTFCMLNGSTATGTENDPTVTRCVNFATDWGFGWLYVVNAFGYTATDPKELRKHWIEPIGPENDRHILEACQPPNRVVVAWGNHGALGGRDKQVLAMLREIGADIWHLGLTGKGQPRHPLFVLANTELQPLRPAVRPAAAPEPGA
jgi:hypothetical protein